MSARGRGQNQMPNYNFPSGEITHIPFDRLGKTPYRRQREDRALRNRIIFWAVTIAIFGITATIINNSIGESEPRPVISSNADVCANLDRFTNGSDPMFVDYCSGL
jgi:hypothetical protein